MRNIETSSLCCKDLFLKGILYIALFSSVCATISVAKTSYVHELAQLMRVKPHESYSINVEVVNKPSDQLMKVIRGSSPSLDLQKALSQTYNICIKGEQFFMSMCLAKECQVFIHDGSFFYMMDTGNSRMYVANDLDEFSDSPTFAPYLKALLNDNFTSTEGALGNNSITKFQDIMNGLPSETHSIYKCVSDASLYSVGYNKKKADELGVDLVFELSREVFVRDESSIVEITVTVEKLKDELDESFFMPYGFGDKKLFYGDFSPLFVRDFLPPADQIEKIIKSDVLRDEYSREAQERPKVISEFKYRANDNCHECR